MLRTVLAVTDQQGRLPARHSVPYTRAFARMCAEFQSVWAERVAAEEQQEVHVPPPNPTRQEQRTTKAADTYRRKRPRVLTAAEKADAKEANARKEQRAEENRQEAAKASAKRDRQAKDEEERIASLRRQLDAAVAAQ